MTEFVFPFVTKGGARGDQAPTQLYQIALHPPLRKGGSNISNMEKRKEGGDGMRVNENKKAPCPGVGTYNRAFPFNKGRKGRYRIVHYIVSLALIAGAFGLCTDVAVAQEITKMSEGDEWTFFTGDTTPPGRWTDRDFDDSGWQRGRSGFGYGNTAVTPVTPATPLVNMRNNYKRVYVRKKFTINDPYAVRTIKVSAICDGPFVAYVNGIEVLRNRVGLPTLNQMGGKSEPVQIDISGFAHELLRGTNVVSFQCENDDVFSQDFRFVPYFEVKGE